MDMSTPLLPEVVPEIGANPVRFYCRGRRDGVGQIWSLTRQSLPYVNFSDNAARHDNTEYLQFLTDVSQIPGVWEFAKYEKFAAFVGHPKATRFSAPGGDAIAPLNRALTLRMSREPIHQNQLRPQ